MESLPVNNLHSTTVPWSQLCEHMSTSFLWIKQNTAFPVFGAMHLRWRHHWQHNVTPSSWSKNWQVRQQMPIYLFTYILISPVSFCFSDVIGLCWCWLVGGSCSLSAQMRIAQIPCTVSVRYDSKCPINLHNLSAKNGIYIQLSVYLRTYFSSQFLL